MGEPDYLRVNRVFIGVRGRREYDELVGLVERARLDLTETPQRADLLFMGETALRDPTFRAQAIAAAKGGKRIVTLSRNEKDEHHVLATSLMNNFGLVSRNLRDNLARAVLEHLGVSEAA